MMIDAFASNKIGDKRLYRREHGIQYVCAQGSNTIDFVIPYEECRFDSVDVINGEFLDTADLCVYAGETLVDQFEYSLNIAKDFFPKKCAYGATLQKGLVIKINYNSKSAKTVGFNILLHEMK